MNEEKVTYRDATHLTTSNLWFVVKRSDGAEYDDKGGHREEGDDWVN